MSARVYIMVEVSGDTVEQAAQRMGVIRKAIHRAADGITVEANVADFGARPDYTPRLHAKVEAVFQEARNAWQALGSRMAWRETNQ